MIRKSIKHWGGSFISGIAFAVLCFIGLNAAMEPASTNAYCGTACHEMNTAYRSWELSVHAANDKGIQVDCVGCHLPPKEKYFTHLFAKARAGAKDLYMHHLGPDYKTEKIREKVLSHLSNETCAHCHQDLLIKPSDAKSRLAHMAAQQQPEKPENKCVVCHESAGHERKTVLFTAESNF